MHYYKFNIGDWALHTSHLSLEEEAIYFRLINFYYDSENPIPLETQSVFRRLRFGSDTALATSILSEFFVKTEKGFLHNRCEELLKDYRKTAKKNKANGAKGGRPKKDASSSETQNKPSGLPVGTQKKPKDNPNYKLETTNQELLTKVNKAFAKPSLEEVQTYFHDIGSMTCIDDGERFFDHFTSNGWKVGGKTAMKDWKASVRGWHKRNGDKQNEKNQRNGLTSTPTVTLRDNNF